jgi:hypothetical protein
MDDDDDDDDGEVGDLGFGIGLLGGAPHAIRHAATTAPRIRRLPRVGFAACRST